MLLERGIRRTRFLHSLFSWSIGIALVMVTLLSSGNVTVNNHQLPNLAQPGALGGSSLLLLTFFTVLGIDRFASSLAVFMTGHSMVHEFLVMVQTHSSEVVPVLPVNQNEESGALELPAGKNLAIVGSNGSGKSTLVKVIGKLYNEAGGTVSCRTANPKIVFMPQDPPLFPSLTVRENILFGESSIEEEAVQNVADRCLGAEIQLDQVCSNEYGGFNPSGGQRQLIAWARLLCRLWSEQPDYVILDEPTSALDGIRERALMEEVLKLWSSVVYITHKGSVARMADYILLMRPDGSSMFGPSKVLQESNEFRELFG